MQNLSKTQAEEISSELLEQERARSIWVKNQLAQRVPALYANTELKKLEAFEQALLFEQAKTQFQRDWEITLFFLVVGVVAYTAIWWIRTSSYPKDLMLLVGVIAGTIFFISKTIYLRRVLKRMAKELLEGRKLQHHNIDHV